MAISTTINQTYLSDSAGRRVRLRAKTGTVSGGLSSVYGTGIMNVLNIAGNGTNGIVFPYQPSITYQQDVEYSKMEVVHANQDFKMYSKTPALSLSVEGDFSVQNQSEGIYALACIHFLRTVTKMNFGSNDTLAGTPPPVLLFDAYGMYMFNALPVIVTQFAISLPKDVDYVPINCDTLGKVPALNISTAISNINNTSLSTDPNTGYAWLPAIFTISVQLTVQNTPQRLRAFNLNEFRNGSLLKGGMWA